MSARRQSLSGAAAFNSHLQERTMADLKTLYLSQLKRSLINALNQDIPEQVLNAKSLEESMRPEWFGHFWHGSSLTMCSLGKLDHLQACVETCIKEQIAGDFVECGVWRGGAGILLRGVLAAHSISDRTVWLADSFAGLPAPPAGSLDERMHNFPLVVESNHLAVGIDTVKENFRRYGLLDEQVKFLPGWFSDTLASAPIERVAILRLDGDYYQSTMDVLNALYQKVSPGGFIIVDDWGLDQMCGEQQAVLDFRHAHNITDEIIPLDWQCAYWRKGGR
jgi:O-methyltransferase